MQFKVVDCMQITELEKPIGEIIPHIFKRPVLSVGPQDSLLHVGTFLAIGPQIYVDGLVVLDGKKPVGRIGGQHIISYILQHEDGWFPSAASQIMSPWPSIVEASEPLSVALDVFAKTRFGFVPITIEDRVATTLSLRDILRALTGKLVIPVIELSSSLIAVKYNTSIRKALQLMLEKGIRNLLVRNENNEDIGVINDRKILEFLLSYEGRRIIAGPMGLDAVSVDLLEMAVPKYIKQSAPACRAAEFLSDINTPCLLLHNNRIVTPWDILMKGLLRKQ